MVSQKTDPKVFTQDEEPVGFTGFWGGPCSAAVDGERGRRRPFLSACGTDVDGTLTAEVTSKSHVAF